MEIVLSNKDLKNYPHFDQPITLQEANKLVIDKGRVARHQFYPFFLYHDSWRPFRKKDSAGKKSETWKPKERPIRYASRKDAYIFTYYRRILSEKYEKKLKFLGIENCPVAYRKITTTNGRGKCNIDFAKDAFDEIERQGNCFAIALDIKGYFENLDHRHIKRMWCELLNVSSLPPDHYNIFKNITKYHVVEKDEVYERLGLRDVELVRRKHTGLPQIPLKKIPKQLCNPSDFRKKICGEGVGFSNIIKSNIDPKTRIKRNYGIPQGASISDLIANFYLMYFDVELKKFASKHKGMYMRYSDDILLVLPKNSNVSVSDAEDFATQEIEKYGNQLRIKKEKTCAVEFFKNEQSLSFRSPMYESRSFNSSGFEYLGFRFDGKNVYIRDSTISRLYRKVSNTAKAVSYSLSEKNNDKNKNELLNSLDISKFLEKYLRVRKDSYYDKNNNLIKEGFCVGDQKTWTFYSYLKRATDTFGSKGTKILPQIRNIEKVMKSKIKKNLPRSN